MKKKISIITPAWNEAENLPELVSQIKKTMSSIKEFDWELIVSENGSTDASWSLLSELNSQDNRVKGLKLSRNFMADGGVMAAMRIATGDAIVIMNADLQDPPELIPSFVECWQKGNQIVYGVIIKRHGEPLFKKIASDIFYRISNFMSEGVIPKNVTDFRLIDKKVALAMNRMGENNRFTRGLSIWTGFSTASVPFVRPPRYAGDSKAPFKDLVSEAFNGMFSFSFLPLRIATILGFAFGIFSVFFFFWQLISSFLYGNAFQGYLTIVSILLLLFSSTLFCLGIIGEYVGKIFEEVKQRPNFIIEDSLGVGHLSDEECFDERNSLGRVSAHAKK